MSKIGNYRVGLENNPLYEEGWKGFHAGCDRDYCEDGQPYYAEDNKAWRLGWDDAQTANCSDCAERK